MNILLRLSIYVAIVACGCCTTLTNCNGTMASTNMATRSYQLYSDLPPLSLVPVPQVPSFQIAVSADELTVSYEFSLLSSATTAQVTLSAIIELDVNHATCLQTSNWLSPTDHANPQYYKPKYEDCITVDFVQIGYNMLISLKFINQTSTIIV